MSVLLRPAVPADLPGIVASEEASFPEDAWSEHLVAEGVRGQLPTITYWVAELDGRVVGHAVLSVASEDAELQRIAMHADLRGQGIGRHLLDVCLGDAAVGGAERLILEVRESNVAALALYAAAGFTELSRRPRYYRDGASAVVLARPTTERP